MMKYTLLLLFLSCAASTPYRIAPGHLERNPDYMKLGIWPSSTYWVELYDDSETTYPFDEAVWISVADGEIDYIDIVDEKGYIYRYGWHFKLNKFTFRYTLTLEDGRSMTPFQYYDSIVNKGRVPI